MSKAKKGPPKGMRSIKVTVPVAVAEYYSKRAHDFGTSVSAAASPVLCAQARGEIQQQFSGRPGLDVRP